MKNWLYTMALGFSLSTMAACEGQTTKEVENVDDQTSPGVTGGGTGAGTTATGVGTTGTPGSLTDVGDTIRTEENQRE
jgi:hypothetical protein